MKVAVSSQGDTLASVVDKRFGRCGYFIVVDTETGEFEAVPNAAGDPAHGAGVGAVRLLASLGVSAVLVGNVGPNAFEALQRAGIAAYLVDCETVGDAVDRFKAGLVKRLDAASGPSHGGW